MKKSKPHAIPNVVPSCLVKVINDTGNIPVWKTLGQTAYTPKAIADMCRANKVQTCWVIFLGYKEFWMLDTNARLAKQVKS